MANLKLPYASVAPELISSSACFLFFAAEASVLDSLVGERKKDDIVGGGFTSGGGGEERIDFFFGS